MIGRKSTSRASAEAARGKASMNARGTSTSPPPGVSRGSPQSSVKDRPASANERNLARAQQLNQRTSTTSQQQPMTGGVQNMNTGQIENLRSLLQANRQPRSNLSEALARRPVGGGQMSMGAGNVMSPSQPTPISGTPQMPSGGAGGMMQSMQGGAQMPQGTTSFQPPAGGFGGMMNSMQGGAPQRMEKGGVVKPRGSGCARKGFGKGTMR